MITGASSGIGATFARHLAARRYDLLLVARRQEQLAALATALQHQHPITAEVLAADLSHPAEVDRLETRIEALDTVDLLINNAGFGMVGTFATLDPAKHLAMIHVHVIASVRLSRAVLPGMVSRGRGAIVNVSSIGAFLPTPGNATYSATKAYLLAFSEALHAEVQGRGVRVQALCPGFTYTEFHSTPEYAGFDRSRSPRAVWMSADEVVVQSLRALERDQTVCIPGWQNRLLVVLARSGLAAPLLRMAWRRGAVRSGLAREAMEHR